MENFCHRNETHYDYRYFYDREDSVSPRDVKKITEVWMENIKEKYRTAGNNNSSLGKFLKIYPLKFKEFCCLLDLTEYINEQSDFERESGIIKESQDIFKKHKVRYESSQLKRFKLVYRIINPLRPMRTAYEVSYKAQLALKNKKYIDAYEQLDLALEEEAKRNSPDELESLYYIIEPKLNFNDLVVSNELRKSLNAALSREKQKNKIFKSWGFNKVIEYGRGTTLNFRGPPGTGKTMAANCLANALGKKLLMVRYDQLQSCWVGQTEKHIQQVFKMAKLKDAVLFFDEADAIALSRDSLDKSWEMSQVNTLLKELERYEGICVFATNYAQKYDSAFERRLTMHIDFELPDKKQQLIILDKLLPKKSREKNLDISGLNLDGLSGGDIKNVALNAAGFAARDNADKISLKHVQEGITSVKKSKTENKDQEENAYLG